MSVRRLCRAHALLWCGLSWLVLPAAVAQQTSDELEAARLVDEALSHEVQGDEAGRRQLLDEAIRRFPDFAPARWQAGFVRQEGGWLDLKHARGSAAENPTLLEYYRRRDASAATVAAQLQLARWCERHGLEAQRKAHLTSVLTLDPGHAVARRELGYLRIGGNWIRQSGLAEQKKELEARRRAFERWQPIAVAIRTGLKSPEPSKRTKALDQLRGIQEASAIEALEWTFAGDELNLVQPVLDVCMQLEGPVVSASLGRFAAFSPSMDVRLAAAAHLARRSERETVPPLLDLLSTQIEDRIDYMVSPVGRLYVRHLFYREGSNSRYFFVSDLDYYPQAKLESAARSEVGNNLAMRFNHYLAHGKMERDLGAEQQAVARANESIAEINSRVIWVLQRLLKADLGHDPYAWWQAWYGAYSTPRGEKQIHATFQRKQESVACPTCEAAFGAKIQTERGAIPIEELLVGDRALSQNPATGELTFQPVLFVSHTADAHEVVTLRIAENELDATPIQRFWVVGRGWIAAADLKPGDRIHGLHGSSRVESVSAGKQAKTTHVVIDGAQNAFLGPGALLGGDHARRETEEQPLPGLKKSP
ncbi:MAG: hypothetical protein KF708_10050 [Pirellulales bacterium]|nr:hypothetical protein [Pirellulales bacterium]